MKLNCLYQTTRKITRHGAYSETIVMLLLLGMLRKKRFDYLSVDVIVFKLIYCKKITRRIFSKQNCYLNSTYYAGPQWHRANLAKI